MGKTEKGAVFLEPSMTSVYDFFQYWRNVADADVEKFLLMYTFLPVEECKKLGELKDQEINKAKEILAYEQTKIIHGIEEADKALAAAHAAFTAGGADDKSGMPSKEMSLSDFESGVNILDIFADTALCASKSEARRLVKQNGASVNGEKITDPDAVVNADFVKENEIILKAGKKRFFRIIIK